MTSESALPVKESPVPGSGFSRDSLRRANLISVAWPELKIQQKASSFFFYEPTLLLVLSGRIEFSHVATSYELNTPTLLGVIDQGVDADYVKYPANDASPFRSLFISLNSDVLDGFYQHFPQYLAAARKNAQITTVELLSDIQDSVQDLLATLQNPLMSDERVRLRIFDLLLVLAEQRVHFLLPHQQGIFPRLSKLLREAPDKGWTARLAGDALAMSESTLRRRLRQEGVRFEQLLLDIRMHHALMLIQTTHWNLTQVADACGYKSVSRFTERFRYRFGNSPAQLR
ncbi:helix-turn-helix transcriptional regulator [Pantoea phytobeneficialis]|uniref:AraC family transcriptional regulator n=1 Tax=Pantoea phytobeneficialis TaxID=2052056 RepID=A0AAP9HAI4_9GAMM|nr:helix-turn-helix transcriptional regulator [Pantoea phytobeneficialis]MDO6409893.1 helix-turn-helix transcriptional regulator [Pantoea phytobeneficialis]QGR09765.1 AraC family transcriptional regulator [Pantoea phytobeneficialis]